MKAAFKKYFIPHEENNYHPHILHTKRAIFYAALFLIMKLIVFVFALSVPAPAFVTSDVMAIEEQKIIQLVNGLRQSQTKNSLAVNGKLNLSGKLKADDMAEGQYFSHTSPSGVGLADFLARAGYGYSVAGENLAMGFTDTESLFQAWLASPTHYSNLIDGDYRETGIGIRGGLYSDLPTIYVVEHFGAPVDLRVSVAPDASASPVYEEPRNSDQVDTEKETTQSDVKIVEPLPAETKTLAEEQDKENVMATYSAVYAPVVFNQKDSSLSWEENKEGMIISANVKIEGDVSFVEVSVKSHLIPLTKQADGSYGGSVEINEKPDDFFKIVLPGIVNIYGLDNSRVEGSVPWQTIKVVKPTPMEKYGLAKSRLAAFTGIFELSKEIYFAFLIFFAIALGLKIFIEIKKQHYHIILQTIGLIGVLVLMIIY